MSTLAHITLSEFQSLLHTVKLPSDTRLTITFEDQRSAVKILKRKRALEAMRKLKGSGNGNLVTVLLKEREEDKLK